MNRKEIALLLSDKKHLLFFREFFLLRKDFSPVYFTEPGPFLKHIRRSSPAAIIVSFEAVSDIASAMDRYPSVAVISGDIRKNIKMLVSTSITCYIYKPYLEIDLAHKLDSIISQRELLNMMENKRRELAAVLDLTQIISNTLDSREILYRIVRKISEIVPVTRCSLIRVDWRRKTAFVVATFEDPKCRGIELSLRKYPEIIEALSSKKHVVIRDVSTDPIMSKVRELITPLGIRSILVIPIFYRSRVIGTLFLRTSRVKHKFTDQEIGLLNSMAHASANSLYNAFLFEHVEDEKSRLKKLSITDYLTGIYNVRYFHHRIVEEFSRGQRYASPISCLMIDIDHFKKINDIYGHKVGDMVLREFASLLRKQSRSSDVLARYGGEEFILLLPQTATEGAIAEAERIRESIRLHRFKSLGSRRVITVSIGIATYPHPKIRTHNDLISCADTALFNAKNSGRNRVSLYGT